jgi:hypothetical protein
MLGHRTIVIGWINDTIGSANVGHPRAAVWRTAGNAADLRKARKYAAVLSYRKAAARALAQRAGYRGPQWSRYRVFVFPLTEAKPLDRARIAMYRTLGHNPN